MTIFVLLYVGIVLSGIFSSGTHGLVGDGLSLTAGMLKLEINQKGEVA